ncbi:hypothetical protein E5D57_003303 [Metarhizium anisopliae]|nr:hypothetical protein E5D57_003303 [Metarhizium anisopliae]
MPRRSEMWLPNLSSCMTVLQIMVLCSQIYGIWMKPDFEWALGRAEWPRASYLGMPTNRESATAIEAISAGGSYTPAFLILTGAVHQIIDGHGSHYTVEFIQYAEDHRIIRFGLPPHLTDILQPLDVVVFQPLKHYHAKALDVLVRDGCLHITKSEFLATIESVRRQAFKVPTIQSAFRKTGIVPWNPQPILDQIQVSDNASVD